MASCNGIGWIYFVFPFCETPEQLCLLENITRAFVNTGLSTKWVKFQIRLNYPLKGSGPCTIYDGLSLELDVFLNTCLVFQEALPFVVQLCVSLLTACLSTVTRTWCSLTTWLCASAPAWWEGPATKMLSPCSLWSTPWWRTSSCSTRASSPARVNCKGRCTRNAWPWSRTTGEGKDIHSVHAKCCVNLMIWGLYFFLFQRAYHWRGRSRSRNHSE